MSDVDLKKLHADSLAWNRSAFDAAVDASKTPDTIETRERVFDGGDHVMAPSDPEAKARFLAQRAADRAAKAAEAAKEKAEIEAYKKLSPIERSKINPDVRAAYELVMRETARGL